MASDAICHCRCSRKTTFVEVASATVTGVSPTEMTVVDSITGSPSSMTSCACTNVPSIDWRNDIGDTSSVTGSDGKSKSIMTSLGKSVGSFGRTSGIVTDSLGVSSTGAGSGVVSPSPSVSLGTVSGGVVSSEPGIVSDGIVSTESEVSESVSCSASDASVSSVSTTPSSTTTGTSPSGVIVGCSDASGVNVPASCAGPNS